MPTTAAPGTPLHREPPDASPATPKPEVDRALAELAKGRAAWARLPAAELLAILGELRRGFATVADRWAEACRRAEGLEPGSPAAGEEWLVGPYLVLRNLRLLATSLREIAERGRLPRPGAVTRRPDGQVVAHVFPGPLEDRLLFGGIRAEVWMDPGVSLEDLPRSQGRAYREPAAAGGVALVLGAGNVSSIGPMDALYKLFVERRVVVYKLHPVNAYLAPLIAEGFSALVERGALRLATGGAEVGRYLCEHPRVDEIHVTGSDKTVEAIAFGTGEEGRARREQGRPRLDKPISSELGNVSPVIVVPGPWSDRDLAYHAEQIASMLINNAGFNCNAGRVIVQGAGWDRRSALLDRVRRSLARQAPRQAYYPGAAARYRSFVEAHPEAERLGAASEGELPWTLIADLDPGQEEEICFRTEAFCSVFAETALAAESVPDYLDRAVAFCNERLWGTLNATLLVHPASLRHRETAAAVERAIASLRYGTVSVNAWAALGYALVVTPWGAFPGHDLSDIQSGCGVVHNTLMFDRPQKTVVRAPFRIRPKPVWFATHATALQLGRRLTGYEAAPAWWKLPGIIGQAIRG